MKSIVHRHGRRQGIQSGCRSMFTFMAHFLVRHPAGDLRSCKSAVLPICPMLFLDGVYLESASVPCFRRVTPNPFVSARQRGAGGLQHHLKTHAANE